MKTKLSILMLILAACLAHAGTTPFYLQSYNPDGSPITNRVIIQAWPPGQPFYVYGTNMVFGSQPKTNSVSVSGFFSNSIYAGVYTVSYEGFPTLGFFVSVLDTTNYAALTLYTTNLTAYSGTPLGSHGLITALLGFEPATNSNINAANVAGALPDSVLSANITRWTNLLVVAVSNATPTLLSLARNTNADGSLWYAVGLTNLSTALVDAAKPGAITNLAGLDAVKPGIVTNLAGLDAIKPAIATNGMSPTFVALNVTGGIITNGAMVLTDRTNSAPSANTNQRWWATSTNTPAHWFIGTNSIWNFYP